MSKQKTTFPMLPVAHWWTLRKRFKQSIPGTVTANYLATVLKMQVNSARANVLPFLVGLGIIDEDGKTLDRAKQWRDDVEYPAICKAIREEIYPKELREVAPGPDDRDPAQRWFSNRTGAGRAAVRRMTVLYLLLLEADPKHEKSRKTRAAKTPKRASKKAAAKSRSADRTPSKLREDAVAHEGTPEIHINLQIHISSDATPDQIDQIFESMAKHIHRRS